MQHSFFRNADEVFVVKSAQPLSDDDVSKLIWLLSAEAVKGDAIQGTFIGPRKELVTPWSTNATEICLNVGLTGISRIERFRPAKDNDSSFDPMVESRYSGIDSSSLVIDKNPEPVRSIADIKAYNEKEGLALSEEEVVYLQNVSKQVGRELTDSEVYAFAQINSEHCRHKIFNGTFVIDGDEMPHSLFSLIKATSKTAPENLVSAYKDNVAFMKGPRITQFRPDSAEKPGTFELAEIDSVLSLKAETHNFPTTVEPFNGASTGSGGEIRDRMAGGKASIPQVGTAVYMTAYPRLGSEIAKRWEEKTKERTWKYQTPGEILIKASNGASDFGNKFGQPLIVGSVLTYEGKTSRAFYGYDRTIMLAGGVGYAKAEDAIKDVPSAGNVLVLLGGDNYRIGMAGGSVSSVDTGAYAEELELSAVQRANPEMQKRVYNAIRALSERAKNPVVMIHDHGAGGHVNCFTELLEHTGGRVDISKLPVGDSTLSAREIICNESQERMGLVLSKEDVPLLESICDRERAPMYVIGEITSSQKIEFVTGDGDSAIELPLESLLGSSPKTVIEGSREPLALRELNHSISDGESLKKTLESVLTLEGVACKDWLTNKVDRSVTGLVATQQCVGKYQLPLNNLGVSALDYVSKKGIATSLGHGPVVGLIDESAGAVMSVAESLTNLIWAPLDGGVDSVVFSANWMWPAKQSGEDARLYGAVEALSNFCQSLKLAVPTGKDSLSMTMRYADGSEVRAPGTVIVTASAPCKDVTRVVTPELKRISNTALLYVDLSGMSSNPLGGSSLSQVLAELGDDVPTVKDPESFKKGLSVIQELIGRGVVLSGHDVSSGGVITAASEMSFVSDQGVILEVGDLDDSEAVAFLFSEKPGVLLQIEKGEAQSVADDFEKVGCSARILGSIGGSDISVRGKSISFSSPISELRKVWVEPSYLLDRLQTEPSCADERFKMFDKKPLVFSAPDDFSRNIPPRNFERKEKTGLQAAIIREKGTNGDRELAYSLFAAGFDVRDVTMSDLVSGRETLSDVRMLAFPGGFSNSDVLGAGRGWAGAFRYNERAKSALESFYSREDTLSIGVCNGCQLVTELDLIYPEHSAHPRMRRNNSKKFESTFVAVDITETNSIMLKPLIGSILGIWVAHGEGRFDFPEQEASYDIALRYADSTYPANPNGSPFNAAGICSKDGRHLALMPHLERSIFSWQWPYYPLSEQGPYNSSPWMLAFLAAASWLKSN